MSNLNRITNDINDVLNVNMEIEFSSHIDEIKTILLDSYDDLNLLKADTFTHFDLLLFKNIFSERLDNFDFIEKEDYIVSIVTPDIENFNFSGLEVLHQILEGTLGFYLEISQDDLSLLNIPMYRDPIIINQERFYLLEYSKRLEDRAMQVLSKKLTMFPFSNTPPLDNILFGRAEEFVNVHFDNWVTKATSKSKQLIKQQQYKRI